MTDTQTASAATPTTAATTTVAGIGQLDHVALGVRDLDERIAFLTGTLGMTLKRIGTHMKTGGRIAMIADQAGFKLELIEVPPSEPLFQHLAYRVADVEAAYASLVAQGCRGLRSPAPIPPAKAMSALVEDQTGVQIQVIKYAPDSPDL
jgi:catechol 2,3-dioxygenase-like lactoylglutathione lyase family enzyme